MSLYDTLIHPVTAMAYRKPVTVSLPPPLEEEVQKLARKQHQTVSELVRAALRLYLDRTAQEAAWSRARGKGRQSAKRLGVRTQGQLQAILDELRHGSLLDAEAPARRR